MHRRILITGLALLVASCAAGGTLESATDATTSPVVTTTPTSVPETVAPSSVAPTSTHAVAASESVPLSPGSHDVPVVHDGVARRYLLHIPADTDGAMPLVVDLHGFTANPEVHDAMTGWSEVGAENGVVVAQPLGLGGLPGWETDAGTPGSAADVSFVRRIVGDIADAMPIDPNRIYASGFSNGGGMAHRLACDASDLVAAIGTVGGAYVDVDDCDADRPIPVISFHGTADIVVPITGIGSVVSSPITWRDAWVRRNGCSPEPIEEGVADDVIMESWSDCTDDADVVWYTIIGGRHTWPGTTTRMIFEASPSIETTDVMWDFFNDHPRSN